MEEKERKDCLEKLAYDPLWLTSGFLDEALLRRQCRAAEGNGGETGRFRHAAFQQLLRRRARLNDADLEAYLTLARRDPDPLLGVAAVVDLLRWPGLGDAQFARVAERDDLVDPRGRALVDETLVQMRLLRALRAPRIDDALFRRCLDTGHAGVHAALIGHAGIADEQLHLLRVHAATPRLRNLAAQTLKNRALEAGGDA